MQPQSPEVYYPVPAVRSRKGGRIKYVTLLPDCSSILKLEVEMDTLEHIYSFFGKRGRFAQHAAEAQPEGVVESSTLAVWPVSLSITWSVSFGKQLQTRQKSLKLTFR